MKIFLRQLKNPFLAILLVATGVSFFVGERNNALVIFLIMAVSVALGFVNEYSAEKTVNDLLKKISLTAVIIRDGVKQEVPVGDLKVGETVVLFPGAIVPADINLTECSNLEIDESTLTGEAYPRAKKIGSQSFKGTTVTKGSGWGTVVAVGENTRFGKISKTLKSVRPETDFQKGLKTFGSFLIRVIVLMTVAIVVVNIFLGKPVIDAVIFSLAIAIGLTPELLPVIVTVSLASGARKLAREEVIVRQLVAIEDLGNMDILCTDKTGTLTEGKVSLRSYFNPDGVSDERVLELALVCNGAIVHHRIIGDPVDTSIWAYAREHNINIPDRTKKIIEEPFNYSRRAMFAVADIDGKRQFIYKGAPTEVLEFCRLVPQKRAALERKIRQLNESGLRVIALAAKTIEEKERYGFSDAKSLNLVGFITLADNPKLSAREAVEKLAKIGVGVKIITGDNEIVTGKVCREIGITYTAVLTGPQIENLTDSELRSKVEGVNIFARTTPEQKLRIIQSLRGLGHTVGFLGDGINDTEALHAADVGISVNTAVDVAKDAASVVLLHKSLAVVADGILTGRKIFQNTMKYLLMGTSSNFGNMFSAAGASFLLPFLPMAPSQILLVNSLYDISQLSIPSDNVDSDKLARPGKWSVNLIKIKKYMLFFGPLSSVYDYLTFGLMYFVFKARGPLFQTGWFVESLITEIMVIFIIRTGKVPFFKSHPSWQMVATCLSVVAVGVILPFTPLAGILNLVPLPATFFLAIIFLTITYLVLVEIGKKYLNAKFKFGN